MTTKKRFLNLAILVFLPGIIFAQDYNLERLRLSISSDEYDEIAPCISADGKTLYFTRLRHPKFERTLVENGVNLHEQLRPEAYKNRLAKIYSVLGSKNIFDPVNSAFNQDVWIAHSVDSEFDLLEHPTYPLNNALPNSVCALTPKDEPVIVNQFAPEGGMQKGFSKVLKTASGEWAFPEPIGINRYHNSGADVNLTISSDGKVMIMSMEREDSYGNADLYVSFQKPDQTWTYPENLGYGVNSPFRESTPHLSKDMRTIYYSSDRTYSGRGCDIYVQEREGKDWKTWSSPRKFRSPINSDMDDSHPYFNEATGYLYFASDRGGSFDVFRIQIKQAEKAVAAEQKKALASSSAPLDLTVGSKIEFSNIYFAQSEATILQKSHPELRRMSALLNQNPRLIIRIAGHTDNIGDKDLLKKLSLERAEAIKYFLIKKENIAPARIKAIGMGGDQPLNDNSTEKLRAQNRRVEIEILENHKVAAINQTSKMD